MKNIYMDYSKMTITELLREESKLKKRYDDIETACLKEGLSFSDFQERAKEPAEGLYFIDKYKRLKQDPVVEYGKEWKGDTYTIDDFKDMVRGKVFVDDDGFGFYATESAKSDVMILPSDVMENLIREDFSHVIWFNR